MRTMLELTTVPKTAFDAMIVGSPVSASDALAVLTILSHHMGKIWTLDNVDMSILNDSAKERHPS